jgi:hypothetical protein
MGASRTIREKFRGGRNLSVGETSDSSTQANHVMYRSLAYAVHRENSRTTQNKSTHRNKMMTTSEYNVVGFRGSLKNHMILRMIFRSGHIDIFGQLGSQLFSLARDALRIIFTDDKKTMMMIFH